MSESPTAVLFGDASWAKSVSRSAEMCSDGSVAMKGPSAWHAAMRTQREPSPWKSSKRATSWFVRTARGIAAATSARLSTDALRTPQISSRASTLQKTGRGGGAP